MTGTVFDLLTERWIPVLDEDGEPDEPGLEQVLLRAHEPRRITGETPPMTAALHRLVLALLHRAAAAGAPGRFGVQAAIAAVHAEAPT